MKKKNKKSQKRTTRLVRSDDALFNNITSLIEQSKQRVAVAVNVEMVQLYWKIGNLIRQNILYNKRADYGEQIVATLSHQLTDEYGKGFTRTALVRMINFAAAFPWKQISATLSHQLSWSHFVELMGIKDKLQRAFYIEMCRLERWSVRRLRERIDSMLFERTAISKKPAMLIKKELTALREEDKLTADLVFRDPYFLNFLGLKDTYSEKDLESSILAEIQRFIVELGSDFAFIARQQRIIIDGEDYPIDLLFYHRKLRRLVVIDLKLRKFRAADKGQMELYLRWLEKHEMREGEEQPVGLILCAGKSNEQIELLQLYDSHIRVAQYLTELPPKKLLLKKLQQAMRLAQARFHDEGNSKATSK